MKEKTYHKESQNDIIETSPQELNFLMITTLYKKNKKIELEKPILEKSLDELTFKILNKKRSCDVGQ